HAVRGQLHERLFQRGLRGRELMEPDPVLEGQVPDHLRRSLARGGGGGPCRSPFLPMRARPQQGQVAWPVVASVPRLAAACSMAWRMTGFSDCSPPSWITMSSGYSRRMISTSASW